MQQATDTTSASVSTRPKVPLYCALARAMAQLRHCEKSGNEEWAEKTQLRIEKLCDTLPHGSGIDGTHPRLQTEESSLNRLQISPADYHHMDEYGYYDGWSSHDIIVTPSLAFGFKLRVTGRDKNDIKEFLYQVFEYALRELVEEYPNA